MIFFREQFVQILSYFFVCHYTALLTVNFLKNEKKQHVLSIFFNYLYNIASNNTKNQEKSHKQCKVLYAWRIFISMEKFHTLEWLIEVGWNKRSGEKILQNLINGGGLE